MDRVESQPLALPPAPMIETSHWFAVDALGQIAVFVTGELGPMPDAASREWPPGCVLERDLLPQLADLDPALLSYAAAELFERPRPSWLARMFGLDELLEAPPRFDQTLHAVLLELRPSSGSDQGLESELGLRRLPSREGCYAWAPLLDSRALRELWREGRVSRALLGHTLDPIRMGMFRFEHEDEDWSETEGVYVRHEHELPASPLRVHALPTSLRRRLARVRMTAVDFRLVERLRAVEAA